MAHLDERERARRYKVNQEQFFLSVLLVAVFLFFKIMLQVSVWGMMGELSVSAVILLYLIPYFILRRRYETVDEMMLSKLSRLSHTFFLAEMLCQIPALVLDGLRFYGKLGAPWNILESSVLFVAVLGITVNLYGLMRLRKYK